MPPVPWPSRIIPQTRPASIAPEHLSWNYTTILNIVFGFVLAAIYWLHRRQDRFGGGQDVARDPVCGMQVDMHHPGAVLRADGHTTYFCSEHCRDRYSGPDPSPAADVLTRVSAATKALQAVAPAEAHCGSRSPGRSPSSA